MSRLFTPALVAGAVLALAIPAAAIPPQTPGPTPPPSIPTTDPFPSTMPDVTTAPVMIVLDASGSMNIADAPGRRIDAAKRAVEDLVASLPDTAQVGLTVYGTSTGSANGEKAAGCRDVREVVPVATVDKARFTRAVEAITARGYTPIGTALRDARAALPSEGPASIVLVSDGEDTCAPPAPCQVAQQLKSAGVELTVHSIGFKVGAAARGELQCIARATGGTYRDAASGAALSPVLQSQVQAGLRPYLVAGKPVQGTALAVGAPVIDPGQYTDTFPAGTDVKRFYSVNLRPGDTLYATTTIVPPAVRGGSLSANAGVNTRLQTPGGDNCASSAYTSPSENKGQFAPFSVTTPPVVVGGADWDKSCPVGGTFVVEVTRSGTATAATRSETLIRIEPPAEGATLPEPSQMLPSIEPTINSSPQTSVGGTSFNDAPALTSGTYSDTISAGETRYYKVHLDWGQRLAYRIGAEAVPDLQASAAQLRVDLSSPVRTPLSGSYSSNRTDSVGGPDPSELDGSSGTPVRYRNRQSDSSDVSKYAVAGDYYLSLGLSYPDTVTSSFTTKLTLTVQVVGEVEAGPRYLARGVVAPSLPPTSSTSSGSTGGSSSGSPSGSPSTSASQVGRTATAPIHSNGPSVWLLAGAAGVLALAAGAVWVYLRRRQPRHV